MVMKWGHCIYTLVLVMVLVLRLGRLSGGSTVASALAYTRYVAVLFFFFILVHAWLTDYPHRLGKISLFLAWIFFVFTITCFHSINCAHKFGLWITCCSWSSCLCISYCTWYIFGVACEGLKALVSVIWIWVMKWSIFILLLHISSKVADNSSHFKVFRSFKLFNNILKLWLLYQISKLIEAFSTTFNLLNLILRYLKITKDQSWQGNIVIERFLSI